MSVIIHKIGNKYDGQNESSIGEVSYLIDVSGFTPQPTISEAQATGITVSLGEESIPMTGQVGDACGSSYMNSNGYTVWVLGRAGGVSNVEIPGAVRTICAVNENTSYGGTPASTYLLSSKYIATSASVSGQQLVIVTGTSGTNQFTNSDFILIKDPTLGFYAYNIFRGFGNTAPFVLADPDATSSFQIINNPSNSALGLMVFTSLDENLNVGVPQEQEGGFLYRVAGRSVLLNTISPGYQMSADTFLVYVYKIDLTKCYLVVSNRYSSISIRKHSSTLNNTSYWRFHYESSSKPK